MSFSPNKLGICKNCRTFAAAIVDVDVKKIKD